MFKAEKTLWMLVEDALNHHPQIGDGVDLTLRARREGTDKPPGARKEGKRRQTSKALT